MKRHCVCFALLVSANFLASAAFGDCDLSTYDRTAPRAITSGLDNGTARFEWATDVDTVDGRDWIWHYIRNLDPNRGLGYRWPKANLRRALGSPLQSGKADCNRYFVSSKFGADDNAPITYGTNEAEQRAAVYLETVTSNGPSTQTNAAGPTQDETASVIESSYTTQNGSTENVRVAISTNEGNSSDNRWRLRIQRTPNVIVGISGVLRHLNGQQSRSLFDQFKEQSIPVEGIDLRKMTGRDEKEAFAGLFSEAELSAHVNQVYLVLYSEGAADAKAAVPAGALRPISTDLVLFDRERRPFFATTLRLLAPSDTR